MYCIRICICICICICIFLQSKKGWSVFGRDLLTEDSVPTSHRPSNLLQTRNLKHYKDKRKRQYSSFLVLPFLRSFETAKGKTPLTKILNSKTLLLCPPSFFLPFQYYMNLPLLWNMATNKRQGCEKALSLSGKLASLCGHFISAIYPILYRHIANVCM